MTGLKLIEFEVDGTEGQKGSSHSTFLPRQLGIISIFNSHFLIQTFYQDDVIDTKESNDQPFDSRFNLYEQFQSQFYRIDFIDSPFDDFIHFLIFSIGH
jgi:hypothetical protein